MKFILATLTLVLLISCSDTSQDETGNLLGTWHETKTYELFAANPDGQIIDTIYYSDILYHFYEDGNYETENELPWGIPIDGEWQYDEVNQIVTFFPDTPDGFDLDRTLTFEVLSLTESELKVMYKYWSAPLEVGGDTIVLEVYRVFEKL